MKCPKCGYYSFDHLDSCKKCSVDLTEHKAKFNLRGFFSPEKAAQLAPEVTVDEATVDEATEESAGSAEESADFGFDFLDEEEAPITEATNATSISNGNQDINIDQPFGADSETIPADAPSFAGDDVNKPGKGPEFSF
jgi:hypothetical protein